MNKTFIKDFLCVLVLCLSALLSIQAGECAQASFTDQELDDLLAPIALYPDPLLAQILPASTYPQEVTDAAAWLQRGGDMSQIDGQGWDENVKAVAHYPDILNMMNQNMDWTANVGDAFLNQPEDVTVSVQRLRAQARAVGNLESNDEQRVVVENGYIQIIPAQPQYIYVPQYDPSVVYVRGPALGIAPLITFGLGLAIGDWLSMDFDWDHRHVIHHGWNRRGWVNNSRPYVHMTNVYINRSRPYINQTWRHDASHGTPEKYRASRPGGHYDGRYARMPEVKGRGMAPTRPSGGMFGPKGDTHSFSNRGKESLGAIRQRPTPPSPRISQRPATTAPGVSRGISQPGPSPQPVQPARTPSGAFGGYRGANETKTQSLRGQASRQSSAGVQPSPAPVSRGSAPRGGSR
jgi:hypothetical protein